MSVKWTAADNTIEGSEGTSVDKIFTCYVNPEAGHSIRIKILSTTLPEGIETETVYDDDTVTGLRIYGTLPQIIDPETYYVTARLEEYREDTVFYYADKYFKVINDVTELSWSKPLYIDCYENTEFSFSLKEAKYNDGGEEKYYINGLNGDEVFRKVSGSLPKSVTLYSNGVIAGTPSRDDINETFTFDLALYRNDELALEPTPVHITVKAERKDIPPTWITESGILDTINAGDEASNIKVIAIINSDETDLPEERYITYELVSGELPTGLSLISNNNQGVVIGTLTTSEIKDWEFTIRASRTYAGRRYSDDRTFWIKTNEASPEHKIDWNGDDKVINAGSYAIGTIINQKIPAAVAADGSIVKYAIIDNGTFPTNIKIGADGSLTGKAEFPRGEFECSVRAYTEYTYVTKKVVIRITKGLGRNALNLSLRINLEYKNEFLDIKNQLNTTAAYGMSQDGYNVDVFPKIDVATLSCFDREVLAGIFNFGAPEIIRFLETRYKTYSDVDVNGNPIETYEVYYKAIDENTYQWDPIKNGNFDYQSQMEREIEQTNDFSGETDNPYFYPMETNAELDFNNETAEPNPIEQKQWISHIDSDGQVYYKIGNVNIETGLSYKIFNIPNVRKMLQQPVYVYQKSGDYYYDMGNQQLFEKSGILVKKLYEKEYEDTDISKTRVKYYMSDLDGTNEEEVKYTYQDWNNEHYVYNLNDVLQRDILFMPEYDTHPFMISSEDDEIYYLEEISNPYCIDREKTKWVSLDKVPEGKEMVLPRITADDLEDDGESFIMLDTSVEPLPKWKRKEYKYWEASTIYNVGDIVYYNSCYYLIIKKFKTGYGFEYNTEYMRELDNDDVKERLSKEYIPSLDLGYYKPGKNRLYLTRLNSAEMKGNFWYKKDFMFWEVICTPVYNTTIETFGVPFYSTQVEKEEKSKCSFNLVVNANNYTAALLIDGVNIISASESIQKKYNYEHSDNSYKVTVNNGTTIEWRVTGTEEYYPASSKEKVTADVVRVVTLPKKVEFTINTIPSDAKVTMTSQGQTSVGKTLIVPGGSEVIYKVECEGYHSKEGVYTVTSTESTDSIEVELLSLINVTLKINTIPSDAKVTMTALEQTIVSKTIVVPLGTRVTYSVTKDGYTSIIDKQVTVVENTTISEELKKMCTYTIETVPQSSNVKIVADGYTQIGKGITVPEGTLIKYTVSNEPNYQQVGPIEVEVTDTITNRVVLQLKNYEFKINVINVENPYIRLIIGSEVYETDHCTVPYGTTVSYLVTKEHYKDVSGQELVLSNIEKDITMTLRKYTLTVTTVPSNASVTLKAPDETVYGKTITVPYDTTVLIDAECEGYFPIVDREVIVDDDKTENIELESTTYTFDLIDEEGNPLISEINNRLISESYPKT